MSAEVRALLAALAALETALRPQETTMHEWREAEAYASFQGEGWTDDPQAPHGPGCVCPACIQDALDEAAQQDLFDEEETDATDDDAADRDAGARDDGECGSDPAHERHD